MLRSPTGITEAGNDRSRLFVYNGGFLTQSRLRRILSLAGYDIRLGLPAEGDLVGIWGNSPTAHRGQAIAQKHDSTLLRVEDAFLRSVYPGRAGEPPLGLLLDRSGVHFDASTPSDLEQLLATHPLDDSSMMRRARDAIGRLMDAHLSKYNAYAAEAPVPDPGYVLVVDQARGDASVTASGADAARFREMLVFAQEENPGARILIKTHPETRAGYRPGYFGPEDANDRIELLTRPVSPWPLLEGAVAVYTVSSQLGFEAILAGHKPRVFGQPFYAGWGLTQDEMPPPRRNRRLTRAQLFSAAMILYPTWYDPFRDQLCELETVIDALEARVRAWRQDRVGWAASGMRMWKRRPLQGFFGSEKKMLFTEDPEKARKSGRNWMVWASKADKSHAGAFHLEDGFLRSRGLGAELVPPMSLVLDRQGIYYDPRQPSDLDDLIAQREDLNDAEARRAEHLIMSLTQNSLSKYNLGGDIPDLPDGHRILVPGQVEDDASILAGAGKIRSNLDLLRAVRAANPKAVIIYKPHPDVEAGLRKGQIVPEDLADVVAQNADPMALLDHVQEVWTMTSLLGFEALLRGVKVTVVGSPFYAGWGLTRDIISAPAWRKARPGLMGLAHAVLIDYPRYHDLVTGLPCPVEVVVERLIKGEQPSPGLGNRSLSKLQGLFATYAHLWR
ncbi:capsular polysaccharide biosynthesis protein [Phaeobacter gallaeciensis]|uniref:capsular polysaccharide biosynthesis protein n=1 Tax=Phaeobacter gallaeciensis TaxID=60890 RepID=UPI00237EFA97|nr:capsular polysaccharide biosynthesis protein [Phaeobacter gallaeciensis]MDE4303078.1 capsular polysaccharide biosynthesis protein [Phaeobacter gallaeciensis]MDE4307470.1 capsular polysaccharide biosynthesis protein [Phaeobacter gallaeciensis]MDE4311928.1 capsular polysaccharide biosynthesis protein [Phaeobacter gallaeciensis]MDE4316567.1 capsular polysaccharide biosynthesis protein [Phaeobacter gallaeciensis]MDE4320862.1 capsular polysaccharide biosynthesis protein [Phaeobacter gallaeciensi